jgi:hypothetical protein
MSEDVPHHLGTGFISELNKLSRQYGIKIGGCGCCGSPHLSMIPKEETVEGFRYITEDSWGSPTDEFTSLRWTNEPQLEMIMAVACKWPDKPPFMLNKPARHGDILNEVRFHGHITNADGDPLCGFITNKGRFVSRDEAWIIADAANQILKKNPSNGGIDGKLFSEDVW